MMDEPLPFHEQLKRELKLHGWSQAYLASRLGCSAKTVNRWEKGQLPGKEYQRLLCELFGKNAEEFGLLHNEIGKQTLPPSLPLALASAFPVPVNGRASVPPDSYLLSSLRDVPAYESLLDQPVSRKALREDWDEAPYLEHFYGRERELTEVRHWIDEERCRVVTILGMGGMGKTIFATTLARQAKQGFEYVFWRSLQHAPSLSHILQQLIRFLSDQQGVHLPKNVDDQIRLLMQYLQAHRCLLVLDNVESLFEPGKQVGIYQKEYEDYGRLFQRIGEMHHWSCLVLTSREKPGELTHLEGQHTAVRALRLPGLDETAGREILNEKELFGSEEHLSALINLYSGNPLALKLIAGPIQEVFGGDIAHFLHVEQATLGDINKLLDQQFQRLSAQEREVLYWLAIEREPVSLEDIHNDLPGPRSKGALFEILNSLRRRSLIESWGNARLTLQPVIMEYVTNYLVKRAHREFGTDTFAAWTNYALVKAQAKEYVRESQLRFILSPIAERLLRTGGREGLKQRLMAMLARQPNASSLTRNYLAGNALNLLIYLGYDLRGMDFSHLSICQASLQQANLPEVNFSYAHFAEASFSYTFGNIVSVAYSPDGNVLAAGSATGEIRVYQAQSNTLLLTCSGHSDAVWSLAFSPDGQKLASSSDDHCICVWDMASGECLHLFREHSNRVRAVTFSPDGRLLASGSDDQTIRIWDVDAEQCLALLHGHSGRVWSLAFSPDGHLLASGSTDRTIHLWDAATWQPVRTIEGADSWIRSVRFHPDGHILASGSDDQQVRLWDVESGSCLVTLQGHSSRVWSVAFSPDGRLLASGSEDQYIRLWDVATGQCLRTLQGHTHGIRSVAFEPGSNTLASGGDDQCLRLWDVKSGRCLRTLQGYTNRIWSVAFSGDSDVLVSSGEDQYIRLWDVATGSCFKTFHEAMHGIRFVACSPDGRLLASCGEDQTVRLWDMESGNCIKILRGHTNWIREVVFSADGGLLASGGEDHRILLWEVGSGRNIRTFTGHTDWIRSLSFSPDGQLLASGSDDSTVRLWNVHTGECLKIMQGHSNRVRAVAFSRDGKLVASASEDDTIRLWNSENGACESILQGHSGWVLSLAFSPDGQMLVSGSDDQTVRLWDVHMGQCLHTLRGHKGRVRSVAFHPNGSLLASGGYDGLILLWDAQSGTRTGTFIGERPYEGMDITGVQGLTEAQKDALRALGAHERA